MNPELNNTMLAAIAGAIILLLIFFGAALIQKKKGGLNSVYFTNRWHDLQKLCGDKSTWPLAIIDADKLLDEALKKNKVKGKTMGERLMKVQRRLSNNDSVWYAHKLRNKLVHEQYNNLKEKDVKEALIGIRQALKDLGALK